MEVFDLCMRRDAAGLWAPIDYPEDDIVSVSRIFDVDGSLSGSWLKAEDECFVNDLVELASASGAERAKLVRTFEIAIFRNNEHGPSETVISLLADGSYALYHTRMGGEREHLRMLDTREVAALRNLLDKIGVAQWRSYYSHDEWMIDDNYWSLELIGYGLRIKCAGSSAAPDGYGKLARAMRNLVEADNRKRKKRLKKSC